MNHRGGWALIKATWASWLQYRSFFFVLAFGWMVPPLVSLFVWSAAAGTHTLAGLNQGEFIAYYLILILVNQLTYAQTNWTVGDVIRGGGLNIWLLRPLPPLYNVLCTEVAGKVVTMLFVLPVSLLLAAVLQPEIHTTPQAAGLGLLSLLLAWGLRFLWGYSLALLAFWSTRADALLSLQDSLVFLLSGMVAPVLLLPAGMQNAALALPFRYMVGFPVEVLLQQVTGAQLWAGLAWQAGWLLLSAASAQALWRLGLRRYSAIGG